MHFRMYILKFKISLDYTIHNVTELSPNSKQNCFINLNKVFLTFHHLHELQRQTGSFFLHSINERKRYMHLHDLVLHLISHRKIRIYSKKKKL